MSKIILSGITLSGTNQNIAKQFTRKLDYTIQDTSQRVSLVKDIIGKQLIPFSSNNRDKRYIVQHTNDFLIDYFDNKYKSFKSPNKGDLSDVDPICSMLSQMADYILYQDKKERRKLREGEKDKIKHEEFTDDPEEHKNVQDTKKTQGEYYEVNNPQTIITKEDLQKYSELKQLQDARNFLLTKVRTCSPQNRWRYNRFKNFLLNDMKIIKEILSGMFEINSPGPYSTVYDFDCDTGYFDENDDYILISENKIELNKRKHLVEIIRFYVDLKEINDVNKDIKYIINVLDEIINRTVNRIELDFECRLILYYKKQAKTNKEISKMLDLFGFNTSARRVSSLFRFIINELIETWDLWKEDWIYTYKVKGNWKTCGKCGEIKLANEKYFNSDKSRKDEFFPYCKKCNK